MESRFDVTVAVLTYKNNFELRRCIESLKNQVVDFPFEIIVIDNYGEEAKNIVGEFAEVKYFFNTENSIGRARAQAVERATYSFVAFLDSDCVAPSHWLQTLANEFRHHSHSKLAAVGSGNRPPELGRFYASLLLMRKVYWGHLRSAQQKLFPNICLVEHLPTTNVLYNRLAVLEAGNFNPHDARVGEDLDLSFRLRRLGFRLLYSPNAVVEHYEADTLWRWTLRTFRFGQAQINLLFRHWHSASLNEKVIFPLGFFVIMFFSILYSFKNPTALLVMAGYLIFIFTSSMLLCLINKKTHCTFLLSGLFISTHLSYSMGQVFSVFRHLLRRGD